MSTIIEKILIFAHPPFYTTGIIAKIKCMLVKIWDSKFKFGDHLILRNTF